MKARYIRVAWIANEGIALSRGSVTADIGEDIEPFTPEEMQRITFAAKMEVVRIMGERPKVTE